MSVDPAPILSLADVRRHLKMEPEYQEEDAHLDMLMTAARGAVENHIDRPIAGVVFIEHRAMISTAMLLLIAHWYVNREVVADGAQRTEMPMAVTWLLNPIRCMTC